MLKRNVRFPSDGSGAVKPGWGKAIGVVKLNLVTVVLCTFLLDFGILLRFSS